MTPMFRQYHELKAARPGAVLFFRMGDFYECFFDDAELVAKELDLTLTSRNKHDPEPIPMAGVPHHAAAGYINQLTRAGHRVAIAEQVEDPALAKGLVRREIVRVVTPGVVLDPTALEARSTTYLVAVCRQPAGWGVAFLEVSTGELVAASVSDVAAVVAEIHRMEPREALVGPGADDPAVTEALRREKVVVSTVDEQAWATAEATRELTQTLAVTDLAGFGVAPDAPAVSAAGAVVRYARDTSGGELRNVHELRVYQPHGFMVIDDSSRRNLEITRTLLGGHRRGSLLHLVDRASTAMGSRRLREWLAFPLLDPAKIHARLDAVEVLFDDPTLRSDLRQVLKEVSDIERISARVGQGTAHARDLSALRRSLLATPQAVALVAETPAIQAWIPDDLCTDLAAELDRWLVDDPPISLTEGGILRRGVHAELDELVEISLEGVGVIRRLEERERERTGIRTLKIRRNKVFGYYIEISGAHVHKAPKSYVRKQTLTNCERYITPELKELEEKVLGADERRKSLEYELFAALRERAAANSPRIQAVARSLATLDALSALAEVAVRQQWVRPEVDTSTEIDIEAGRHPVVEALMDEERFVPNDVRLDTRERQLVVLTGPNMAGKSTILRQVALIALLAQIGSFVPATRARVGLCDRIFTRVGAADDLTRGQSTFMVEMSETSAILHHATRKSLVILDEIGRGTSTYDGLAIAWAVAEDLTDRIGCRAMFATHYHELCELADTRLGVINQSVAVSEWGERIVFLRLLKDGGASRSYGIQCARLAGLPKPVVERAKGLLKRFEKHAPRNDRQQLSLFGGFGAPSPDDIVPDAPPVDPVREALTTCTPDELTPRAALDLLYRLKGMVQ